MTLTKGESRLIEVSCFLFVYSYIAVDSARYHEIKIIPFDDFDKESYSTLAISINISTRSVTTMTYILHPGFISAGVVLQILGFATITILEVILDHKKYSSNIYSGNIKKVSKTKIYLVYWLLFIITSFLPWTPIIPQSLRLKASGVCTQTKAVVFIRILGMISFEKITEWIECQYLRRTNDNGRVISRSMSFLHPDIMRLALYQILFLSLFCVFRKYIKLKTSSSVGKILFYLSYAVERSSGLYLLLIFIMSYMIVFTCVYDLRVSSSVDINIQTRVTRTLVAHVRKPKITNEPRMFTVTVHNQPARSISKFSVESNRCDTSLHSSVSADSLTRTHVRKLKITNEPRMFTVTVHDQPARSISNFSMGSNRFDTSLHSSVSADSLTRTMNLTVMHFSSTPELQAIKNDIHEQSVLALGSRLTVSLGANSSDLTCNVQLPCALSNSSISNFSTVSLRSDFSSSINNLHDFDANSQSRSTDDSGADSDDNTLSCSDIFEIDAWSGSESITNPSDNSSVGYSSLSTGNRSIDEWQSD